MSADRVAIWIAASLWVTAAGQGETLYERDGVTLEGTVRMVTRGAGVCQVLAESHPPDVYEEMQANHGQPLHVWRLDFAARNGSGRRLEQLTAHFRIDSEWPPCTNWTGPDGRYQENPQWAGSFEVLQRPSGMQPGEEVSDTVYVLAFHDQEPRFENWQVDYRFASGAPAAVPEAPPLTRSPVSAGGSAGLQLPPEIQADRYLLQAVQVGDPAAARAAMERLGALQAEHGLEPVPEDHFRYARAWEAAGEPERAKSSAVRYLQLRGREAERYTEALELMNRAESGVPPPPAASGGAARSSGPVRPGPDCVDKAEGAACWKELASHPGCHVWDSHYYANQTVAWTGGCSDGLPSGVGTLKWVGGGVEYESTGLLQDGKHEGYWVLRAADGGVQEGPYVDGEKNGHWVLRFASGTVEEGPLLQGKQHGHWVIRLADGGVQEGPFVDGEKNGHWVLRFASGTVEEGPVLQGKQHGRWVTRFDDGTTLTVDWAHGVPVRDEQ